MVNNAVHLISEGLDQFDGVIASITVKELTKPTPCAKWSLKQLVNHVVYEVAWATPLLMGETITQVGDRFEGDLIHYDPKPAWHKAASALRTALQQADLTKLINLSYGEVTTERYLRELATDLTIHSWDTAKALGIELELEPDLVSNASGHLTENIEGYRSAGIVADEVAVDGAASDTDRLVGKSGRDPNWSA